jgi:hypothetical protein
MAQDKKSEEKKISRREFVVGGGAIVAGGALSAALPGELSAAKKAGEDDFPISEGYLVYELYARMLSGA